MFHTSPIFKALLFSDISANLKHQTVIFSFIWGAGDIYIATKVLELNKIMHLI